MIRLLSRPHLLSRLASPLSSLRWNTQMPPPDYPFSRNQKAIEEWRKTLSNIPLKSPFTPVTKPTETAFETFFSAIESHQKTLGDVPVMIDVSQGDKSMTYQEFTQKIRSLAGFMKSLDFPVHTKASIVMGNCFEWPMCQFAVWAVGGTVVGTSSLFTSYEMEKQFMDSGCRVVMTSENLLGKVMEAAKNCPEIKTIICSRNSDSPLPEGVVDLNEATSHPPLLQFQKVSIEDPCVIFYSSGTTGEPKGAVISHRAINANVNQMPSHWENEIFPCLDVPKVDWSKEYQILNLPFFHIFGNGLLNWFFTSGAPMLIMDKFDPEVYLTAIQKYKPRMLFVVPPILVFLAKHSLVPKFDLSSLEFVLTGAAPAGKDISDEFITRFPQVRFLAQGFGMTEAGFSHLPFLDQQSEASCGIIAAACEQKLADISTGHPVAVGERGELCLRGTTLMTEYLNKPEATAQLFDEEGWLHTGDIAYMNDKGQLYIVDRLKELIKVKGMQVAPAELEDLLLSHPKISDVAIAGVADEKWGERVRAFVVRNDKNLSGEEVRRFVADKLSDYKHITGGVKFVNEIPKSPAGKILRRLLRDKTRSATNEDEEEQ